MVQFPPALRTALRVVAVVGFTLAGLNHFREPDFYRRIIPSFFPAPAALVIISGICEIAGGLGLAIPSLRRPAMWGLIALLIAVFPANLYMALRADKFPEFKPWLLWARLPLQFVIAAWVWAAG